MVTELQLVMPANEAANPLLVEAAVAKAMGLQSIAGLNWRIAKRSIDARSRVIKVNLKVEVSGDELTPPFTIPTYKNVANARPVHIVGAGPAGLFAALRLLEVGLKPIVIERGKNVKDRRRDLMAINRLQTVNPHSNYCFGEGGAGTYSDGKLYTRSGKRGSIQKVLNDFVVHGASPDILVEAHPHIGTNKLPKIIEAIRNVIIAHGGEVHFNTHLSAIKHNNQRITQLGLQSVRGNDNPIFIDVDEVILATGHSARDVFSLLHTSGIAIEAKPFALGVRIEHQQALVDTMQYHCQVKPDYLPPAAYSWVEQVNGRGVYSFCMCPGGIIAPCATSPGEVVTNGWSPSKRNNPFANSGIVVELRVDDFKAFKQFGPLAAMHFQSQIEQQACAIAGGTQVVPAQRMVDFVNGKVSATLPETSYQPGIASVDLEEVFPAFITNALQGAFRQIKAKMPNYYTNDAVLHAPESRTSSPVRIPRDKDTLQHIQLENLYPCAEGAGYAGGIVSAAIDGINVVNAITIKRTI